MNTLLLKPCPVCNEAVLLLTNNFGHYCIECPECGRTGSIEESRQVCIDKWNNGNKEGKE